MTILGWNSVSYTYNFIRRLFVSSVFDVFPIMKDYCRSMRNEQIMKGGNEGQLLIILLYTHMIRKDRSGRARVLMKYGHEKRRTTLRMILSYWRTRGHFLLTIEVREKCYSSFHFPMKENLNIMKLIRAYIFIWYENIIEYNSSVYLYN